MAKVSDEEALRRFILRARRVQMHSLVQDWEGLLRYTRSLFNGHLDVSGRMTLSRDLPKDEELFESLVARLRPLTLKSEPVYYGVVFKALERVLDAADVDEGHRSRLESLRSAWDAAEIQGTQVQGYAIQSARKDGMDAGGSPAGAHRGWAGSAH